MAATDFGEYSQCMLNDKLRTAIETVKDCLVEDIYSKIKSDEARKINLARDSGRLALDIGSTQCGDTTRIMEDAGAEWIGTGSSRDVYRFDNCVIKIAKDIDDRQANVREGATWDQAGPLSKQYLAPVISIDRYGEYVTMPAAVTNMPDEKRRMFALGLEKEMTNLGYTCYDIHRDNVGELNGRPVIIDYGFGMTSCNLSRNREMPRIPEG